MGMRLLLLVLALSLIPYIESVNNTCTICKCTVEVTTNRSDCDGSRRIKPSLNIRVRADSTSGEPIGTGLDIFKLLRQSGGPYVGVYEKLSRLPSFSLLDKYSEKKGTSRLLQGGAYKIPFFATYERKGYPDVDAVTFNGWKHEEVANHAQMLVLSLDGRVAYRIPEIYKYNDEYAVEYIHIQKGSHSKLPPLQVEHMFAYGQFLAVSFMHGIIPDDVENAVDSQNGALYFFDFGEVSHVKGHKDKWDDLQHLLRREITDGLRRLRRTVEIEAPELIDFIDNMKDELIRGVQSVVKEFDLDDESLNDDELDFKYF